MAPARDKWVRRFIIPETARHKRGFTIYKITSVVFLKASHEEVSKVSVWKRYNDFKKLHSELHALYSRSQIKESFPTFPKSKFFGRFEAEVIEERRECALKFLEFIGRHSYLYSSDIFIKFFETSHTDHCSNDCSQSLSSDTSEDDRHAYLNSIPADDMVSQSIFQHVPKSIQNSSTNSRSIFPAPDHMDQVDHMHQKVYKSKDRKEQKSLVINDGDSKAEKKRVLETIDAGNSLSVKDNILEKVTPMSENDRSVYNKNSNYDKNTRNATTEERDSANVQTSNSDTKIDTIIEDTRTLATVHDGSDLPLSWTDSTQYILIAAAHMSAAFRHEAIAEYEEAFTQYKMGISSLLTGVQSDSDKTRAEIIKEKISKYLERAEKLYNRHLNCNISLLNKPVSELQYYKVLKIMRSVMLVKDIRQNCLRIVKAIEKSSTNKESISNYILRGQVPYMVRLHACIETETTVFLILHYLSRGKLWDFVTFHYKSSSNEVHDSISIENNCGETFDSAKEAIECTKTSMENSDFESTNPTVQTDTYSLTVEERHEMYSNMPTTQLLEKAQILLQSVNATLKESNTVASRLRESNHLLNEDNTVLLNIKNTTHQADKWNIILTDVNEVSNETLDVNRNEFQRRRSSTIESVAEKNVKSANCSPESNTKNGKSQYITHDSSLSSSYKDLSLCERKSTSSSVDSLKTISTHFSMEEKSIDKADDITDVRDLNRSLKTCYQVKSDYIISDDQIRYVDTTLSPNLNKSNSTDIEQELWIVPENVIRLWAAEILLALEALHQQEVIVFDLKPDNILLDDNDHVQLTYIIPGHDPDLSKHTQPYASPELCMFLPTVPLTPATDIWSFGVILYELLAGNKFQTRHPGVFHSHSIINIPNKVSENAKSLLLNILKYQPNERMQIPEIKQHRFFKDIDWSSLVNPI